MHQLHKKNQARLPQMHRKDFLFVYDDAAADVKGLLLYLKNFSHSTAYIRLASHFVPGEDFFYQLEQRPRAKLWFIAPPAQTEGGGSHAQEWAKALAHNYGGEFCHDLLQYTERRVSQKLLTKKARQGLRFKRTGRFPGSLEEDVVIFCDDLLTTGSSAHAAWLALNKPPHFFAWTIAFRQLQTSQNTLSM